METALSWIVLPTGGIVICLIIRWGAMIIQEKYFTSFKDLKEYQNETGAHRVIFKDHRDNVPTDWTFRIRR